MNPSLLLISASLFVWGIGEGMFYMFQPFYLSQLGANPEMIGYILGAFGFMMMIAHIPAGYLADRIGRRPMLISAWLIGITAAWIMALANSLPVFIVGMLLYGFTAFVASPLNSYVTAARGKWSIGRAITLSNAAFGLGIVIGPFTGGWIAGHYGLRLIYFIAGSLFIFSTLMIWMIAPQPREQHNPDNPAPSLFGNRRFLAFIALGFFVTLAMYLPQPFQAKFLQDVRGLSLEQIGLLGTLGGIGNTVMTFAAGFMNVRLGFLLGQASAGVSTAIIWQMKSYGWFAASYFLLGGYRAARTLYTAQIRPLVLESQMGLAYGISETVQGLTLIIAPIVSGIIYQSNPILIYPIALAGTLLAILFSLFFTPRVDPQGT